MKNILTFNLMVICMLAFGTNVVSAQTAETEYQRALDYYYQDDYSTVYRITDPLVRTHFPQNTSYYYQQPGVVFRVYKLIITSLYEQGYDEQIQQWVDHIVRYFSGPGGMGATAVIDRLDRTQI